MNRKFFAIAAAVLVLIQLTGCGSEYVDRDAGKLTAESEYRLSHGISSFDVLTEQVTYTGGRIEIDYEFENGNVDANVGLLLFLDGCIQPFSLNAAEETAAMNMVDLPADSKETITLSFTPVKGTVGDMLPLHIVAIFDAKNTIDSPTLALPFFQELSQAFPAAVIFEENSTNDNLQSWYETNYNATSHDEKITEIDANQIAAGAKLVLSSFLNADDIESKQAIFGLPIELKLSNTEEKEAEYHIFAFFNNEPVPWNEESFISVTVPSESSYSANVTISSLKSNDEESGQLFFIAVPIHEATQQAGTMVLKTKTIALCPKVS